EVSPADQPIDQADGAVVADAEPLRQLSYRRLASAGVALDREQRLVLAGRQSRRLRRLLAECCEAHQQIAKFGQDLVVVRRQVVGRLSPWALPFGGGGHRSSHGE